MIKGRVHAIVIFTLIPTIKAKPSAAKNAKMTRATPTRVIITRDSTLLKLKRKRIEKAAMIKIETIIKTPLLKVISSSILPVVPIAPESNWNAR